MFHQAYPLNAKSKNCTLSENHSSVVCIVLMRSIKLSVKTRIDQSVFIYSIDDKLVPTFHP